MKIRCLNGDSFRGQVGTPLPEGIVFQVTDNHGQPLKDKLVTITADPPGSVSFGAEPQTVLKTREEGTVAVSPTPRSFGPRTITAAVAGEDREVTCNVTLEGSHPDVEVREMNGRIVAIRRQQPQPQRSYWPIALVAIAVVLLGSFIWLFERGLIRASGTGGKTTVVERGGSTVDSTARTDAQEALRAVNTARTEFDEKLSSGLAATTAHGEGYAREGDRSYYRAVSPRIAALERARAIAVEYGALT
ncbi:hypothetical protein HY635_00050, partial [Candidatus Uhrbacteria bacterium]|nr:hypothetical protein [Candidatus Uhrbacteria bacterium]